MTARCRRVVGRRLRAYGQPHGTRTAGTASGLWAGSLPRLRLRSGRVTAVGNHVERYSHTQRPTHALPSWRDEGDTGDESDAMGAPMVALTGGLGPGSEASRFQQGSAARGVHPVPATKSGRHAGHECRRVRGHAEPLAGLRVSSSAPGRWDGVGEGAVVPGAAERTDGGHNAMHRPPAVQFPRRPPASEGMLLRYLFPRNRCKMDPEPQFRESLNALRSAAATNLQAAVDFAQYTAQLLAKPDGEDRPAGQVFGSALLTSFCAELQTAVDEPWLADPADLNGGAFRVLLLGRTQAGKSTLLEYLTHGCGIRIGDGRQRFTRDVAEREIPEVPGAVLVDTPGVGAKDGEDDFRAAFAQLPAADLVLWVMSDDPEQEQTTRALRLIGALGKPVIAVLNCHVSLKHPLKRDDFIAEGLSSFVDAEEHFDMLRDRLAEPGSTPVATVAVHARAAFDSRSDAEYGAALHARSGGLDLLRVIAEQMAATSRQRRLLRLADATREPIHTDRERLSTAAERLANLTEGHVKEINDLGRRVKRELKRQSEALGREIERVIDRRRLWHLSVEPSHDVERLWRAEVQSIQSEVNDVLETGAEVISERIKALNLAVREEWSSVPANNLNLPGFGSVWPNRMSRLAIHASAGMAGGVLGVKIGSLVGTPGGPPGALIGAGVGLVLGVVVSGIAPLIDRIFKDKATVLRERRVALGRRIGPQLDALRDAAAEVSGGLIDVCREHVAKDRKRDAVDVARLLEVVERWRAGTTAYDVILRRIDTNTAEGLLMLMRPGGGWNCIRSAARMPGRGIMVEVPSHVFAELALYPVPGVEPLIPVPARQSPADPTQAAHLMLGISDAPFTLESASRHHATVTVHDEHLHEGVAAAWQEFATWALNGEVVIRQGVTGSVSAGSTPRRPPP